MITLELMPEILSQQNNVPFKLVTEASKTGETTLCTKEDGTVIGEAWQSENPHHQVRFFQGKGGFCAIITGPGLEKERLTYIGLPGSEIDLGDTRVKLPGEKISGIPEHLIFPHDEDRFQEITDQAMILGAGLATRFEPLSGLTTGYSKPAVPLLGNTSVICAIANHLQSHGFHNIVINTFYEPDCLKHQLKDLSNIHYLDETAPSGTAGGLAKALKEGLINREKPVLIVQGDAVTDCHFSYLLHVHHERNAAITIGGQIVPDDKVSCFGIIQTDGAGEDGQSGNITCFKEKPSLEDAGPSRFANSGFYILSPEIYPLFLSLYEEKVSQGVIYDYAHDLFPAVLKVVKDKTILNKTTGLPMTFWAQALGGYWSDIGNPSQYIEAVHNVASGHVDIALPENIHEFYENGVIFWPGTQKIAKQMQAKLSGNVIVTTAF